MRLKTIVIAAGAAVTLLVGAVAVSAALSPGHPGCEDIRAYQERYGEVETLGDGDRPLTILGDSYSAGDTLRDRGERWVDVLVEQDPSLRVKLDAIGLTGFGNPGVCGEDAFTDRIARAASQSEGPLILQGGLNDVFVEPADLERAVDTVLETAASAEQVIVIGPIDAPGRDGEAAVDELLAREAEAHGVGYVSTLDWELPFGADRVHLTAEGHAAYAARIRDALGGAGVL